MAVRPCKRCDVNNAFEVVVGMAAIQNYSMNCLKLEEFAKNLLHDKSLNTMYH
jgi:hypothetical protein